MDAAAIGPTFIETNVSVSMDPRLQRIVARRGRGIRPEVTATSGEDEVSVLARVSDLAAWEALSEVRVGMAISPADNSDAGSIVTARIPAARIEAVRNQPFVRSLKAGRPLRPALAAGAAETRANPDQLPEGTLSDGGRSVVIGIVDYGCDFAHRNFRLANGQTRLRAIWHQGGIPQPSSPFGYGRVFTGPEIDAALQKGDPYAALGYGPRPDTPWSKGSHGTHVMDIAAGNGLGSDAAGFAPHADIVFVDVRHDDVPFAGPEVVGSNLGDSTQLLEAVRYIFDQAGDRPCVINISLGTNGGPHDGTSLVEQGIDRLIAARPNRCVTIAASNSFADGIHASGIVPQGGSVDLSWLIPNADRTANELELWYPANDLIDAELIDPAGRSLGVIQPGQSGAIPGSGEVEIFIASRLADPNNGDGMIGLFLEKTAAAGTWTLRLHGRQISDGRFHAWIERDDLAQSSFAPPHDNSHTIGSISCGHLTIAVGSYDAHKSGCPLSWFSSAGPTRDDRKKPELSAPGHDVNAAWSRTGKGVVAKSGTSMAAPAVAGTIALMLGEAQRRGIDLSADQIRQVLLATVRRPPPAGADWDARYGHGRIDAAAAIAGIMRMAPPLVTESARPARKPARKLARKPTPKPVRKIARKSAGKPAARPAKKRAPAKKPARRAAPRRARRGP
jgi:subtilisin family serine protease